MAKTSGLRPAQTAPQSGQSQQLGPHGGQGKEVTVTKGEPLPPTPTKSSTCTLVDPTRNKSGRN